jgi:hypothetical protein
MRSASDLEATAAVGDSSMPEGNAWAALEHERAKFAERFFALSQVHASLDPQAVVASLGQALQQFVGAGSYVIYSVEAGSLYPVLAEGTPLDAIAVESVATSPLGEALTSSDLNPVLDTTGGAGCAVPMRIGADPVGLIVIRSLLPQKARLEHEDCELLALLAGHGAIALAAGRLYLGAGRSIPSWMAVAR